MESADTHHDHGMKEETLSAVQQHDPIESGEEDTVCEYSGLITASHRPFVSSTFAGVSYALSYGTMSSRWSLPSVESSQLSPVTMATPHIIKHYFNLSCESASFHNSV